jgi:hypothetical protein
MTLCPVAIVAGCKKCPVVGFCPLKSVIGDYKKDEEGQAKESTDNVKK